LRNASGAYQFTKLGLNADISSVTVTSTTAATTDKKLSDDNLCNSPPLRLLNNVHYVAIMYITYSFQTALKTFSSLSS